MYKCRLILFSLANKANYEAEDPASPISSACTQPFSHSAIISFEWFYIMPIPSQEAIHEVTHALTQLVPLSPAPTSTNIKFSSLWSFLAFASTAAIGMAYSFPYGHHL